jgi:hypothetical protein
MNEQIVYFEIPLKTLWRKIMRNTLFIITFFWFVMIPIVSMANIIHTTWTGQIDSLYGNASLVYNLGDEFVVTIKHETIAPDRYTVWDDGNNQIAEYGQGDDTILEYKNIDNSHIQDRDASFSFDYKTQAYIDSTKDNTFDGSNYNFISSDLQWDEYMMSGDGIFFSIFDGLNNPSHPNHSSLQVLGGGFTALGFIESQPVPEPTTMLLLGTGLVGLVGSRMKKKKR